MIFPSFFFGLNEKNHFTRIIQTQVQQNGAADSFSFNVHIKVSKKNRVRKIKLK